MDRSTERQTNSISMAAYFRLLRSNRNFRVLWSAQIISELGDWFYSLALYNLLLQVTGRASSVAMALVLQVLPQFFVGPIAGVVNDRMRRKLVMITADVVRALVVLAMLFVRSGAQVWLIYPLLLIETVFAAFFEPARSSVIPNITSPEDLLVANTLASATWSVNLLIGAAIGGVTAALLGRDAVFVINAVSFVASALLISGMKFQESHVTGSKRLKFRELFDYSPVVEGLRYVRRNRGLLPVVFVKAGELMIGPSWVLFTVMARRYFPVRGWGLDSERGAILGMSLLMGARGLGALVGPFLSSQWAGQSDRRLRFGILVGYIVAAIGYSSLGAAPNVWVACGVIALAHCGGATIWVFSSTLLQLNTEDSFRGRVFATELGFSMLTIAVGAYVCGVAMDHGYSPKMLATVTGLVMFVPAALWSLTLRFGNRSPTLISADS